MRTFSKFITLLICFELCFSGYNFHLISNVAFAEECPPGLVADSSGKCTISAQIADEIIKADECAAKTDINEKQACYRNKSLSGMEGGVDAHNKLDNWARKNSDWGYKEWATAATIAVPLLILTKTMIHRQRAANKSAKAALDKAKKENITMSDADVRKHKRAYRKEFNCSTNSLKMMYAGAGVLAVGEILSTWNHRKKLNDLKKKWSELESTGTGMDQDKKKQVSYDANMKAFDFMAEQEDIVAKTTDYKAGVYFTAGGLFATGLAMSVIEGFKIKAARKKIKLLNKDLNLDNAKLIGKAAELAKNPSVKLEIDKITESMAKKYEAIFAEFKKIDELTCHTRSFKEEDERANKKLKKDQEDDNNKFAKGGKGAPTKEDKNDYQSATKIRNTFGADQSLLKDKKNELVTKKNPLIAQLTQNTNGISSLMSENRTTANELFNLCKNFEKTLDTCSTIKLPGCLVKLKVLNPVINLDELKINLNQKPIGLGSLAWGSNNFSPQRTGNSLKSSFQTNLQTNKSLTDYGLKVNDQMYDHCVRNLSKFNAVSLYQDKADEKEISVNYSSIWDNHFKDEITKIINKNYEKRYSLKNLESDNLKSIIENILEIENLDQDSFSKTTNLTEEENRILEAIKLPKESIRFITSLIISNSYADEPQAGSDPFAEWGNKLEKNNNQIKQLSAEAKILENDISQIDNQIGNIDTLSSQLDQITNTVKFTDNGEVVPDEHKKAMSDEMDGWFAGLTYNPWTRGILNTAFGGWMGYMGTSMIQQGKVARTRRDGLLTIKNNFTETSGLLGCQGEDRNNSAKPECYCYTSDNKPNPARANHSACKGRSINAPGGMNYLTTTSNSKVCVDQNYGMDPKCTCKYRKTSTGGNSCMKVTVSMPNAQLSPSTFKMLGAAMGYANDYYSGNSSGDNMAETAGTNAARIKEVADQMQEQLEPGSTKKRDALVKALSDAFTAPAAGMQLGGGASDLLSSSNAPLISDPKKAAEELEKSLDRVPPSIDLPISSGETETLDPDLLAQDPDAQMATEIAEVMEKDLDYGNNDISNQSTGNIFDLLSNRYQKSGMRRLFDESGATPTETPAASDINP